MSSITTSRSPVVLTLTLNPALDHTIAVSELKLGEVNRALSMQADVGGKGINVASCLADFGVPTAVSGLLGRDNAAQFEALFAAKRIDNRFHYLDGLTRINTKLVDRATGETTDVNMPGPSLSADAIAQATAHFEACLDALLPQAGWVVLAGSLPPGWPAEIYAHLIDAVRRRSGRCLLDASGAALAAAIAAGPDIAKPNRDELAELVGHALPDVDAVVAAGRKLLHDTPALRTLVVSMGGDGALFLNREEALLAHPAEIEPVSTVGAGDAMVAGIVAATLERASLKAAAQLATAFSAAKLARLGPHLPAPDEVRALAERIRTTVVA